VNLYITSYELDKDLFLINENSAKVNTAHGFP
jgi:hypothetical protein